MKIKKGDLVKVLTGSDRGKTGKVLNVFPKDERVTVEGVNLKNKHARPKKQGQQGQKIQFPAPMAVSNLMLVCPKCNQPTRVAMVMKKGEKKQRSCKKCEQNIV